MGPLLEDLSAKLHILDFAWTASRATNNSDIRVTRVAATVLSSKLKLDCLRFVRNNIVVELELEEVIALQTGLEANGTAIL